MFVEKKKDKKRKHKRVFVKHFVPAYMHIPTKQNVKHFVPAYMHIPTKLNVKHEINAIF